jgi:hypothetical protein
MVETCIIPIAVWVMTARALPGIMVPWGITRMARDAVRKTAVVEMCIRPAAVWVVTV